MKIVSINPVLLSAPYAGSANLECRFHLPSGYRTCGLVELALDNGSTGLGEAYLAVFAPHVFEEIVRLAARHLVGQEADPSGCYNRLCRICDYWSLQGAARHATSAIMSALLDAVSKSHNIPAWRYLSESAEVSDSIQLYGSGGDSDSPDSMTEELGFLGGLGIDLFKIRARKTEVAKARWVLQSATTSGIRVGIDMAQNLARPSQSLEDVIHFIREVQAPGIPPIAFLEETFGPDKLADFSRLRVETDIVVAGGEIVTTAEELLIRMEADYYDWVQPDATVMGGPFEVMRVFEAGKRLGVCVVVHCWGGGVCQMANYHAAFAGGANLAEFPMPAFPLREALLVDPLVIKEGRLERPDAPGLGVILTPEIKAQFPFRENAIYNCIPSQYQLPPDDLWR